MSDKATGWKSMLLTLKVLFVLLLLWTVGSVMNLPYFMANGLPLIGIFVYGFNAFVVILCLDFIGPIVFLFALWNRKSWGVKWASLYIGLFLLNGLLALLTVRAELGLGQILIPNIVSLLFLTVIYLKRSYFTA